MPSETTTASADATAASPTKRKKKRGQKLRPEDKEPISRELELIVPRDVDVTPPTVAVAEPLSIASLVDALAESSGGYARLDVRIGVVTMTKKPVSFERWLSYHAEALRISHFFLRVEDTPELEPLLTSARWSERVVFTSHTGTVRDWQKQTNRQAEHVGWAIGEARRRGLTHLLHIDDDELLYLPRGLRELQRELARAPRGVFNLHALTLEALAPRDAGVEHALSTDDDPNFVAAHGVDARWCPFTRCRAFRHRRAAYCAYGSSPVAAGKSFGVLGARGLEFGNPHHFSTDPFYSAKNGYARGTCVLPAHVAAVLHYESCSYPRWALKFSEYARRETEAEREEDDDFEPPGFFFYATSVHACRALLEAEEAAKETPSSVVCAKRMRDAADNARHTWAMRKLEPAGLPPAAVSEPLVVETHGCTLLPPLFDADGRVQLPPSHFDGLPPMPPPRDEREGEGDDGADCGGRDGWREFVGRAHLPPEIVERVLAAVDDADGAGATGDEAPHLSPRSASRDELDALARRAGLPMGHRLRIRALAAGS